MRSAGRCSREGGRAGVVYSLAYGDQPALICDLVDWARAAGFPVVAAGRGHKWLPHFAQSTPETVWGHYGLTPEEARVGGLNPKMFNSFLDGSKPAIETTAVCNATGLTPAPGGLLYPRFVDEIPALMRPRSEGRPASQGQGRGRLLAYCGRKDHRLRHPLRRLGGVRRRDGLHQALLPRVRREDRSIGRYACMYKRWHLIGLEVGISVASVGLRGEPTGCATGWRADAVAVAKKPLQAGKSSTAKAATRS